MVIVLVLDKYGIVICIIFIYIIGNQDVFCLQLYIVILFGRNFYFFNENMKFQYVFFMQILFFFVFVDDIKLVFEFCLSEVI